MTSLEPLVLISLKIILLILLALATVFSWVVFRKVRFLAEIILTEVSPTLSVFTVGLMLASFGLFFLAIFVL